MSKPLLTCRQMSERINGRNPSLSTTRFTIWHTATIVLALKPAQQATPTEGQRRVGGAIMFFTAAQEAAIERRLLKQQEARASQGERASGSLPLKRGRASLSLKGEQTSRELASA